MARWERQIAWKGACDLLFPAWHGPPEMPSSDRAVRIRTLYNQPMPAGALPGDALLPFTEDRLPA